MYSLIFLSYITSLQQFFLLLLIPTHGLPQTHSSSASLQKKTGLPGISTKQGITKFIKSRPRPSASIFFYPLSTEPKNKQGRSRRMKGAIKVGWTTEGTIFCSNGAKDVDQGNLLQNRMEGFWNCVISR